MDSAGSTMPRSPSYWFLASPAARCALPSLPPGNAFVQVTFNGQDFYQIHQTLRVERRPRVVSMSHNVDSLTGGSTLKFEGSQLFYSSKLMCVFGGIRSVASELPNGLAGP